MLDNGTTEELDMLLIAEDPRSKAMLEIARKAAKSNASILISGETGVGKELIANYIHQHSPFSCGPYVTLNCAALPDNMIESILFGYEKGAFTGAIATYQGKFEQADGGTLFLDEITEIPLMLQAKLLRVLQEKKVERLGGKNLLHVRTRIIAATNRNLQEEVLSGNFRRDLYYRLNVVPVHCLPLRERKLDILPLSNYFIKKYSDLLGKEECMLDEYAKSKLFDYHWPGNVRELENLIHRLLIMINHPIIKKEDIIFDDDSLNEINRNTFFSNRLQSSEAKCILDVLKESDGKRTIAAEKLNMSPRTLRYKLSKLKLSGVKIP